MNPILVLTHNNLEYTKRCVASALNQDIDTWVQAIDNDSSDGSYEWLKGSTLGALQFSPQIGVSAGWNVGLNNLFHNEGAEHVLVIGNDTVLPKFFYRELLSYNLPFVTGVAVDDVEQSLILPDRSDPVPNPDFSAFLIRRDCWEKVGPFDERLWGWCSDNDFHVRAHRLGIPLWKANVRYFHVRSRTIELAPTREKRALEMQADADRLTFYEIWKAHVGSPQYRELFSPEAFGIDAD
jgi:GT2 family glycosyltransferase